MTKETTTYINTAINLADQYRKLVKDLRDQTRVLLRYWSQLESYKQAVHNAWNAGEFNWVCAEMRDMRIKALEIQESARAIGLEINM